MAAVFRAFFGRQRWDLTLQCRRFHIRPDTDIFHDPLYTDGGVHNSAHELLRPYLGTHERAMVVLDQRFGGGTPSVEVREGISRRLNQNGWQNRSEVVVIDPELEVWLWQDSPHVERALAFDGASLRAYLLQTGVWPAGLAKPGAPKDTIQGLMRVRRHLKAKVVYTRIAKAISVSGCTDPAFLLLARTMRIWFPLETAS